MDIQRVKIAPSLGLALRGGMICSAASTWWKNPSINHNNSLPVKGHQHWPLKRISSLNIFYKFNTYTLASSYSSFNLNHKGYNYPPNVRSNIRESLYLIKLQPHRLVPLSPATVLWGGKEATVWVLVLAGRSAAPLCLRSPFWRREVGGELRLRPCVVGRCCS